MYDPNMFDEQGQRHKQPYQTNLETAMRAMQNRKNSQAEYLSHRRWKE
jgi:hypothetical protein